MQNYVKLHENVNHDKLSKYVSIQKLIKIINF